MDWNMYSLHQIMLANPGYFLRDVHGNPVTIFGQTVFDFTQPAVQELWLDVLRNASQSGVIDGAFLVSAHFPFLRIVLFVDLIAASFSLPSFFF